MPWPSRSKRHFAITGDSGQTALAEVQRSQTGIPSLRLLALVEGNIHDEVTVRRLLAAATGSLRGQASLALPLGFFEIVTVSLPGMPEMAVGKALPYHLAKAVDRPLSDFIYDWQITKAQKDKLQVTVYLFPAKAFFFLRRELAHRQLEIRFFEADVFAAFAYLAREGRLKPAETTMGVLVWPRQVSLAVYEQGKLMLVRTVALQQPQAGQTVPFERETDEQPSVPAVAGETGEISLEKLLPVGGDHILAGFNLLSAAETADEPPRVAGPSSSAEQTAGDADWSGYLQSLNLEIIRTRDYYASVVKGQPIRKVVIGGGEECWDRLEGLAASSVGLPVQPLIRTHMVPNCPPLLAATALGTGARW
ncbi:MAG: hypothetical protein M0017_06650 [Desulfobacteraceae bacterium]|nr:hypothetical protein [Desulfobacteraceae bacterium]